MNFRMTHIWQDWNILYLIQWQDYRFVSFLFLLQSCFFFLYILIIILFFLQLILKGFDDKIGTLIQKVLSKMKGLTIDTQRFNVLREKVIISLYYLLQNTSELELIILSCFFQLSKEYKNLNKEDQFKRALYNANLIQDHIRWHCDYYIQEIDSIFPGSPTLHYPLPQSGLHSALFSLAPSNIPYFY
jgi:hypothetical protein